MWAVYDLRHLKGRMRGKEKVGLSERDVCVFYKIEEIMVDRSKKRMRGREGRC